MNIADLCNAWIDLVVPFVQSAVKWGTAEKLQKIGQNAGGLMGFILSSVPQDSVIRRSIKSICAKHSKHESMEPIPSNLSTAERAGLLGGNHDVKRASLMSRKLRLWRNAS